MTANESLSRNQERFVQGLSTGQSIVDAAKLAGISESTAHRWLKDPLIQAERKAREEELAAQEQAEIKRITTSGYALIHRRVEALNRLAEKLEQYLSEEDKVWLLDVKTVGFGEFAERVDLKQFNDALFREYRATFDDISKELGQRVKKQEIKATVLPKVYLEDVDDDGTEP